MSRPKKTKPQASSGFIAVARELECHEDKERFERQLEETATAKVSAPVQGSRAR